MLKMTRYRNDIIENVLQRVHHESIHGLNHSTQRPARRFEFYTGLNYSQEQKIKKNNPWTLPPDNPTRQQPKMRKRKLDYMDEQIIRNKINLHYCLCAANTTLLEHYQAVEARLSTHPFFCPLFYHAEGQQPSRLPPWQHSLTYDQDTIIWSCMVWFSVLIPIRSGRSLDVGTCVCLCCHDKLGIALKRL